MSFKRLSLLAGLLILTGSVMAQPIRNTRSPLVEYLKQPGTSADMVIMSANSAPRLVSMNPDTMEKLRKEGCLEQVLQVLMRAKEQNAAAGIPLDRDYSPTALKNGTAAGVNRTAITGTRKALVLLADFSDETAQVSYSSFTSMLFGDGNSMKKYYQEVSRNQFTLTGEVSQWFRVPQTSTYYAGTSNGIGNDYPHNARKLVEDLVTLADPYIDFSQYDNKSTGYVDALFVIHAGRGAEVSASTTDIWSHQWSISSKLVDGVRVSEYSIEPEYEYTPGDLSIGVFCHEYGHVLGLPDLYDTDYTSRGLGKWCLMASGSWNGGGDSPAWPSAWCRVYLGWETPVIPINNLKDYTLNPVETGGPVVKLWSNTTTESQYFLLENRSTSGYDTGLPGSGLMIYHVDNSVYTSNENEWYSGHTTSGHYLVALEQADGLFHLEKKLNTGDTNDPWPGVAGGYQTFNGISSPDSKFYNGTESRVAVENIIRTSGLGSSIKADLTIGNPATSVDMWQTLIEY